MINKKWTMTTLMIILLLAACARELAPSLDPLPTEAPTAQSMSPTGTPLSTQANIPTATQPVPSTKTLEPAEPTSTPTVMSAPPTATSQPPEPSSTPQQGSGTLGQLWNLADVRFGIYEDKLRFVVEMVERRDTLPFYEITEVDNARVPFPTGHDPAWGNSRIDLVISDLYAYNTPGIGYLMLVPDVNPIVTRIGSYPTFDDALLGFSIGLKAPAEFKVYELTNPVRIVIDVLNPAPDAFPTPTPTTSAWTPFTNPVFAVALSYPANWTVDPGYTTPELGEMRYAGTDGFFIVNSGDALSIDVFTNSEANHILKPYGSAPTIENLTIQGQDARLIWPSADQSMPAQAALIVVYPQPVTIGGYSNTLFVLYADTDHIRAIANTLRFVSGQ